MMLHIAIIRRLAPCEQDAQSLEGDLLADPEVRGGVEGNGNALFTVVTLQQPWIIPEGLRHRHQGDPVQQSMSELPQGGIETHRGDQRHAVIRQEADRLRHSQDSIDIPPVLNGDAFRYAGCAGCVDDVGDVFV